MSSQKNKFKQTEIGIIPEDWEIKRIGDEIELCYGKGLTEKKRIKGDFPVFGSHGMVGEHNEFLVEGPGIIIGRKGSVGEVTFSNKSFWPIDTTYYIKLKKNGNIRFWYYFLLTLKLNKMNSHSAVPGLNRDIVYEIKKGIPDDEQQFSIAKILSDLDSKIELNQQMNHVLESIGQAIFKHWFVDFEFPNEEGNPYKSSGGEMVDSEFGEIPGEWRVGKLGELIELKNGFAFKSTDFVDDGIPVIKIKNVKPGKILLDNLSYVSKEVFIKNRRHKIEFNDIVITMSGNRIDGSPDTWVGKVALFNRTGDYLLNQRVGIMKIKDKENISKYYLSQLLSGLKFQYYFITNATSSGGQANISPDLINNSMIIIPSNLTLKLYHGIAAVLFKMIFENEMENEFLSQIRDLLLPKLMSGKIRVPVEA